VGDIVLFFIHLVYNYLLAIFHQLI